MKPPSAALLLRRLQVTRATKVAENYVHMGTWFSVAALLCIIFVIATTFRKLVNSPTPVKQKHLSFFVNMKEIFTDGQAKWVFGFAFMVVIGIALVSNLQMFFYEHFMVLGGKEKSIAHGSTMLGMGIGAVTVSILTRHLDKKGAVFSGVLWSVSCNLLLAILFLGKILHPGQTLVVAHTVIPIAFIIFVLLHGAYWFGNGIMMPIAISMMADISELCKIRTGKQKDGGYSAVFTFVLKSGMSIASFIAGYVLVFIGFEAGNPISNSSTATFKLCAFTLLSGPLISLLALGLIRKYSINKKSLERERNLTGDESITKR
ncbi:MAG: MFS transporter [Phycisphaerales bacterium]